MDKVAVDLTDNTNDGFWKQYLFLFPARSNIWELLACLIVTFCYGMLMSMILHKDTLLVVRFTDLLQVESSASAFSTGIVLTYVTITLSSYSLFS